MSSTRQSPKAEPPSGLASSLAADLRAAQAQLSILQNELAGRDADIRAFEARIGAVEAFAAERIAEARRRAQDAEDQVELRTQRAEQQAEIRADLRVERAEQRVLAIYQSSSWRLMGPFRRMTRLTRRLLGRG